MTSAIPIDIIYEIFTHMSLRVHRAHEFPWNLAKVCSQWRILFFSMQSTFWGDIEIEWPRDSDGYNGLGLPRYAQRIEQLLTFFLNCVQGQPFCFSLFMKSLYNKKESYHVRWILKKLLEHSKQWDGIAIHLQEREVRLLHYAKLNDRIPLLQRLELFVHEAPLSYSSVCKLFHDAPLLTRIALRDVSSWEFKWSSLTSIYLQKVGSARRMFNVLRETINLVELAIGCMISQGHDEISTMGFIYLPFLEFLSIDGVELLTALKTPALKQLEIGFVGDEEAASAAYDVNQAGITVDYPHRSTPRLQILRAETAEADIIKEILPHAPHIELLILLKNPDLAEIFEWLAQPRESSLSHLQELWASAAGGPVLLRKDLKALCKMVACRNLGDMNDPSPQKLILETPDKGKGVTQGLKLLCRNKGVELVFTDEIE